MREVVQKVLATEAEAKRLVETARAEADDIVTGARKQAEELLAQARRDGRAEAGRILEAAAAEAEREREQCLGRAATEIKAQIRLDEPMSRHAVDAVVSCVCGLPQPSRMPPP